MSLSFLLEVFISLLFLSLGFYFLYLSFHVPPCCNFNLFYTYKLFLSFSFQCSALSLSLLFSFLTMFYILSCLLFHCCQTETNEAPEDTTSLEKSNVNLTRSFLTQPLNISHSFYYQPQ